MDKRVKTIVYAAAVTVIGAILPTLAALLVYGLSATNFIISDYIFRIGMLTAFAGGFWSILPFFIFKSKLRKTKRGEEVEVKNMEGLRWDYILMAAGVLIVIVAYITAVI